jgi:uncharacterized protein (TIGR00730 family)
MENHPGNDKMLKAYEDIEFLKSDDCRPVRLQLELLKPDVVMRRENVLSTIVLMGSARQPSPELADEEVAEARAEVEANPESGEARRRLAVAETMREQSQYYTVAREFAELVTRHGQRDGEYHYVITTGGGGGIMEAGNRGAHDAGGKSVGLNISLPFEQVPNAYISNELCFMFHYFSVRKMHFMMRAKALCAFPGGFGTMDEVFEALTLIQTRKIERIPIVLFSKDFWEKVIDWQMFVDHGLILPEDLDIFHICERPEEAWEFIQEFWKNGKEGVHREV